MKQFKTILFFTTIILFITSCTIRQEYHFNNDYSGSVKSSIDFGMFADMLDGDMSEYGLDGDFNMKDSLYNAFAATATELENTGAKNIDFGSENNESVFFIYYEFDNIKILNEILKVQDYTSSLLYGEDNSNIEYPHFEKKIFKKLIYHGGNSNSTNELDIGPDSEYYSMMAMLQMEIIFSFERKIKKTNNDNAEISENKHKAIFKTDFTKIMEDDFQKDIMFKLGKF